MGNQDQTSVSIFTRRIITRETEQLILARIKATTHITMVQPLPINQKTTQIIHPCQENGFLQYMAMILSIMWIKIWTLQSSLNYTINTTYPIEKKALPAIPNATVAIT